MRAKTILYMSTLLALAGCKKSIDPGYKAALEARHQAFCGCLDQGGEAQVTCYQDAVKEHAEPPIPGGGPAGIYMESLKSEDATFIKKMDELTSRCDVDVSKRVTEYQEEVARQAKEKKAADDKKRVASATAPPPASGKPAKAAKGGKHAKGGKKHKKRR
jgi:hypothetical protein